MEKISIYVKTLGGFEISCNGQALTLGRNKGSKYIQLLSRVCIEGDKGVLKEDLQEDIYSDDLNSKSNLNNSLNNLIYQFRKVAEKAGIPDGNIINFTGGRYITDPDIDVETDVVLFEKYVRKARNLEDSAQKTELFEKAFSLYKGDFLPELDSLYWISKRAEQYRLLFDECVDYLAAEYEESGNYQQMAEIFRIAVEIDRDCEWQVGEIDAYRLMGNYRMAYALYEDMVRYYAEELGVSPTEHMQRCYQKLQDAAVADDIADGEAAGKDSSLKGNFFDENKGTPYECLFPEMSASYHILSRNMERHGLTVFLMLLTIADYEGKEIKKEDKAEKRMESLKTAIGETLRHGDAFCRYSRTQYLILLTGTGVEECMLVHRRLQDRLKELAGSRATLNYRIISYEDLTG